MYPYEAEVLDVGSKPRSMQLVPLERIDEDRKGIDTRRYGDNKNLVDLGSSDIHVWSFDEESPLVDEEVGYYWQRMGQANWRACETRR